jgi:hypothetical protein
VDLAEISASESYVHLRIDMPFKESSQKEKISWVAHLFGIHQLEVNSQIKVYVPIDDIFVFDMQGKSVTWPVFTQAALKEAM